MSLETISSKMLNTVVGLPVGAIMYYPSSTIPAGWLECNGNIVTQAMYPDLYAVLGSTYNTGSEGAGNFRLPDLRGEFIRGWDHGRGVDSGRGLGSSQVADIASHSHNAMLINTNAGAGSSGYYALSTSGVSQPNVIVSTSGTETRPRNLALVPCIKAYDNATSPSYADFSTLATALNNKVDIASFTGINQILSENGFQKIPGGLIIQWGTVICSNSGPVTWTFPIAFPNLVRIAGVSAFASIGQFANVGTPTLSSVPVSAYDYNGVRTANTVNILAVGY